jgi:hypothetical protein
VGFICCFNTYVQKTITFACQCKKINNFNTCIVGGNTYAAGVLEGVLNHLPCGIVEDEVGFGLANAVGQAIMFLHAKEN